MITMYNPAISCKSTSSSRWCTRTPVHACQEAGLPLEHATPCSTVHTQAGDCGVADTPMRKVFSLVAQSIGDRQSTSHGTLVAYLLTRFC